MMGRFEARLEVDNREAAADSSWMSCSDARTERFEDNILAGSKASNRFPDEVVGAAVGRSSRMGSGDMFGNAWDAWVASSRAVGGAARNGRVVLVPNHHLQKFTRKGEEEEENE